MTASAKHMLLALLATGMAASAPASAAPYLLLGLDQKQVWNDNGERVLFPTGNDRVAVLDLARPESPRLVAALPLENSVAGPPVNVAVAPGGNLALVADSYTVMPDTTGLEIVPTNKLFVIALDKERPRLVQTLAIGQQPSGLSINVAGTLALVGYRAENAVGVLRIEGGRVREIARVPMGDSISHVAFTPDGKRALAVHHDTARLSVLKIDGDKVTVTGEQVATTPGVYVAEVTPDGRRALTIDKDVVSVIDMAGIPRALAHVPVAAGGEGLTISPRGNLAISVSLRASNGDKRTPAFHENGAIDVLAIGSEGHVRHVRTIEVGRIPEPGAFSPDGRYFYLGNFLDENLWVFRVAGGDLVDTGKRIKLPGRPASGRASPGPLPSTVKVGR